VSAARRAAHQTVEEKDTPSLKRSDWIVTIDGRGGIAGVPRDVYAYTCRDMTLDLAIAAAVEMWQIKHCADPDADGDILDDWQIYSVHAVPCYDVLTVSS
jgi:hypothetical protein